MSAPPDHLCVFDLFSNEDVCDLKEVNSDLLREVAKPEPAQERYVKSPKDEQKTENPHGEVSEKMVCSACKCPFTTREEQREHYKLDWHRFNLRQKMSGLPPLTSEEFEKKTGAGDLSSISGSESDSEDSDDEGGAKIDTDQENTGSQLLTGRLSSKVVLKNSSGEYLSVYRCILHGKLKEDCDVTSCLKRITKTTVWIILMTGGGHFAGAVFEGKNALQHKTFHRYTVRAKRGTAQGLRDSQNRSHTPKSAGAALRRYNEAALAKDIQDLLLSWTEHLDKASAIFMRAPSYNKFIFFGGRTAPIDKKDPRIRTLPFPTRRATFREVQRVHELLSSVQVYGKDTDTSLLFSPPRKTWKKNILKSTEEKCPDQEKVPKQEEENDSSDQEEQGEIQLEMEEVTLGTLDLRETEIYPSKNKKKRRKKKKQDAKNQSEGSNTETDGRGVRGNALATEEVHQETESAREDKKEAKDEGVDDGDDAQEYAQRDALFTACKVGDVAALCRLLQQPETTTESLTLTENQLQTSAVSNPLTLLNQPIDSSGFTLLHVAAAAAQKEVVRMLLVSGADPACRDNKGRPPYIVAPDKDTRNVFRKYMAENPDKYDYKKAQVPGPLTAETESKKTEKKKAQKAQKKQREKEQKEDKRRQEHEEEERRRFASLTDREKRALAAEKRLAEQAAATGASISNVQRCWSCGESLLGKIPFHYLDYSFCTPRCLQAHRKANAPPGKS